MNGFKGARRDTIVSAPWFVFAVAGILLWPVSVLGFAKAGGSDNALIYSTYMLNAALAFWIFQRLDSGRPGLNQLPLWLGLTAIPALVLAIFLLKGKGRTSEFFPHNSPNTQAYEVTLRSPDEFYFPWHPLSVYLAEGRLYHSQLGVCDRLLAGIAIEQDNLRKYLPPRAKYIAYRDRRPVCILELLPEFSEYVRDARLPGWTIMARWSAATAR